MNSIIGYKKEQEIIIKAIKNNKHIFLSGDSGYGKSFLVDEICEEQNFQPIYIGSGNKRQVVASLNGTHKILSTYAQKVIIFDDLPLFLQYDKGKKRTKKTKKNPNPVDSTIQGLFEKLILDSKIPIIFINNDIGKIKSKERVERATSQIHKLCLALKLGTRSREEIKTVLLDNAIFDEDNFNADKFLQAYNKYRGDIRKVSAIYRGGSFIDRQKTLSTKDFIKFACSDKKLNAYKYAVSQKDADFPILFFLAWTEFNADHIYGRETKEAMQLQRIITELDSVKYGGYQNKIYSSIIHLLPQRKPFRLDFPTYWGVKSELIEPFEKEDIYLNLIEEKKVEVVKKRKSKKKQPQKIAIKNKPQKKKPVRKAKMRSLF